MEINIQEVVSSVRTVDSESLVSPAVLTRIVAAVTEAMRQSEQQDRRSRRDTRIAAGSEQEDGVSGWTKVF